VQRIRSKLLLFAAVAGVVVLVPAAGMAQHRGGAATPSALIYAGAADPTYLDPAIVSDGESFRVTSQIMEGLVGLRPGTTTVIPMLATAWKADKSGKVWTFNLRKGVKFHDGTAFNAAAVCFNFNRWYNFKGAFQDAGATFYYQAIFSGFAHNESSTLGAPLYRSCKVKNANTAVITLAKRNGPFIPSLALQSFAMQSPKALKQYDADSGTISNGAFRPTGSYAFSHPTGTGPYMFGGWTVKEKVVLNRNPKYWGKKAKLAQIVIRPIADNTARVQALQTGEINGMDLLQPQDVPTVNNSSSLKVLSRPSFNVAYVGMNLSKPPTNNLLVRKAIAYGLDRQTVVNAFYGGRGQVATQFQPPQLFGWSPRVVKYPYDPAKAKQLLQQAGLTLPVSIDFWYPTGVSRPYMPDPQRNFEAFSASLEKSGFKVVAHSAPWRPDYVAKVNAGDAGNLNMIGWSGDYGDPDNFIGTFFQGDSPQFGFHNNKLTALLNKAEQEVNFEVRVKLYQQANEMIMRDILPGVPYAHSVPALGMQKSISGYIASPIGTDLFAPVSFGGQ
jgi:peptide/nickel transport system substrate-binding protein